MRNPAIGGVSEMLIVLMDDKNTKFIADPQTGNSAVTKEAANSTAS